MMKYNRLDIVCLFIERSDRLSKEARFLLKCLVNDHWRWDGLATDSIDDLVGLKRTVAELLDYLEWVWNSVDLTAEPSDVLKELIDELKRYQVTLSKAIKDGGVWQLT